MTIFDIVTAKKIATYVSNHPSNKEAYLGETLWGVKKKMGLDLSWFKGSNGLPLELKSSAFDAKAELRDRLGFKEVSTKMPFFKEAMNIREELRQELNGLLQASNDMGVKILTQRIFDDKKSLIDGAKVTLERMRMQLLVDGTISATNGKVAYDYDFGMKADRKVELLADAQWTNPDADIFAQIKAWQKIVLADTGNKPTKMILNDVTFGYLMKNNFVKALFKPMMTDTSKYFLSENDVKSVIKDRLGLKIAVYDKMYKSVDGSNKKFYPDNQVTLVTEGLLGDVWFGVTPEESDLMTGATSAKVEVVNTGMAITTSKEIDPVNVSTKVSMIALPSFEKIDEIFSAKVA